MSVMSCASQVCTESQSAFASSASHLLTSYCNGQYLPSQIQSATQAEAPKLASISAAQASSSAAVAATKKGAAPTQGGAEGYVILLVLISTVLLMI
jgi:hypothetical protein